VEPEFTLEEVIQQIQSQLEEIGDRWTTREIVIALGMKPNNANRGRVHKEVYDLQVDGLAQCVGKKPSPRMDGSTQRVNAYTLTEEAVRYLVQKFTK